MWTRVRPAVNKGGTALMTPFADESRQRAFLLSGIGPLDGMEEGHSREPGRRRSVAETPAEETPAAE